MNESTNEIAGLVFLSSPVHGDDRGDFREWYSHPTLQEAGIDFHPEQANVSHSRRNVIRGLHFSTAARGQAKLVTCVDGDIRDVIVDVRIGSPTFGRVATIDLRGDGGTSVYIPSGLAHGFAVRSERATVAYLLSSPYEPSSEHGINPLDAELAISWGVDGAPILSEKDRMAPSLADARELGVLPTA